MKNTYRQGDVLLKEVLEIPTTAKKVDSLVIAEGEITGHHHKFIEDSATLYKEGDKLYVNVAVPTPLTHEEHKKIIIEPGMYEISSEREWDYSEEELKKVID